MAAAPYATAVEYAERTAQHLSDTQHVQVTSLLAEASALMRANAGDLDGRIAAGLVERVVAEGVCVRIVHRYLANPTGVSSMTTGPFGQSWSNQQAARAGLYLTADDLAALVPAESGVGAVSVGTIRVGLPTRPADRDQMRWRT